MFNRDCLFPKSKRLRSLTYKKSFDWLLMVAWVALLTFSIGTWALLIVIVSVIMGA